MYGVAYSIVLKEIKMGKEINAFELIAKKGVREIDEMRNLLMAYEVFFVC